VRCVVAPTLSASAQLNPPAVAGRRAALPRHRCAAHLRSERARAAHTCGSTTASVCAEPRRSTAPRTILGDGSESPRVGQGGLLLAVEFISERPGLRCLRWVMFPAFRWNNSSATMVSWNRNSKSG